MEEAVLKHLEQDDISLSELLYHLEPSGADAVALLGDVVFDLYQRGVTKIIGIGTVSNKLWRRELDVKIRRVPKKKRRERFMKITITIDCCEGVEQYHGNCERDRCPLYQKAKRGTDKNLPYT